jgi:plastocyanin
MNKSTLHEMFGCETKIQIPRSIWLPALLRWMLLFTVLIVLQVLWGVASASATPPQTWHATVGAQSSDKGHQALAFLPNEIWINAGDSIEWRFDVDEVHTVTFVADSGPDKGQRPLFADIPQGLPPNSPPLASATFDGSASVSSPGGLDLAFVSGATFTVNFPNTGDFKQVCLFHPNMTGVVHVLKKNAPLPHNQDFYDRQAADQRRDLLSDRDGGLVAAFQQHGECAAHDSLKVRVVTAGIGLISATAGGSQTLSVVRFMDDQIHIRAGDTVEWTNQDPVTPHTVTFGTEPPNVFLPFPTDPLPVDAEGVPHVVINTPGDQVSSGIIAAAAQDPISGTQTALGATRFRVTFPNPGAFPYICTLHDTLGMKGMVIVR